MTDKTTAQAPANPGATGQPSPEVAARWPSPHEWPSADSPAIEWARFYRDRLGARVLPSTHAIDRRDYARHLTERATRDYREAHDGRDPPPDVASLIRDDALAMAADSDKAPVPVIAKVFADRTASDADFEAWFRPSKEGGFRRGICVRLGYSTKGLALAQVDVDPRHGGDITGEWAMLPGPMAETPGGGRHVFTVSAGVRASNGRNALAPGVEVRVEGWAMVPSGDASPKRAWLSTSAPCAAPPALCRAGNPARAHRPRRDPHAPPAAPWEAEATHPVDIDPAAPGHVAHLLGAEVASGERNSSAVVIVGLLARPGALPDDAVAACLRLLAESGAGMDWDNARIKEEADRWRTLLTRGPRDTEFAAEVLATWITTRDVSTVPWSASKARGLARSVWKTADRREEGRAGEEDMGHAGTIEERVFSLATDPGAAPMRLPPPVATSTVAPFVSLLPIPAPAQVAEAVAPVPAVAEYIPLPQPPAVPPARECPNLGTPTEAACKCDQCDAAKAIRRDAFLRRILPFSAQTYPNEAADRDMERVPLKVTNLYPFCDFITGEPEAPRPEEFDGFAVGHGYGRWFGAAIGGLLPGDFKVWGGAGAKIGKTHFVGQGVEGLALASAARVLGIPGYETAPLIMPVWVTEMPKPGEIKYRMMARLYGFDMAALTQAGCAAEALGIQHMASEYGLTPERIVEQARAINRHFRSNVKTPIGFVCECMQLEIALDQFPAPSGTGRAYVNHASGVNLINHMADAIALRRRDVAANCGVPEDQILPLVVIDPGQRFIGEGNSAKQELDGFLSGVLSKLCRTYGGLGAVVLMTSDTTKAAVKDIDAGVFLSADGGRLAADIFAGSQAMAHVPDTVIALCGEASTIPYRRTQWARILVGRTGAPQEAYPFTWETHLGRFRPRRSEPLRAPPPDRGGGGRSVGERDPHPGGGNGLRMPPLKGGGRGLHGHPGDS